MTKHIRDEIKYATFIRAAAEKAYDGIATAEGLDNWFTEGASVDPRPGGDLVLRWREFGADRVTDEAHCPILEAQRPERFVFQWRPDNPSYATTVEIDFEPAEGGTIVRLREYGYENTPSGLRAMLDCAAGWGEALTLWKFSVEYGLRY